MRGAICIAQSQVGHLSRKKSIMTKRDPVAEWKVQLTIVRSWTWLWRTHGRCNYFSKIVNLPPSFDNTVPLYSSHQRIRQLHLPFRVCPNVYPKLQCILWKCWLHVGQNLWVPNTKILEISPIDPFTIPVYLLVRAPKWRSSSGMSFR